MADLEKEEKNSRPLKRTGRPHADLSSTVTDEEKHESSWEKRGEKIVPRRKSTDSSERRVKRLLKHADEASVDQDRLHEQERKAAVAHGYQRRMKREDKRLEYQRDPRPQRDHEANMAAVAEMRRGMHETGKRRVHRHTGFANKKEERDHAFVASAARRLRRQRSRHKR